MNGTPNTLVLARKSTLLLCLSLTMTLVSSGSTASAQTDGAAAAETPAAETPAAETPAAETPAADTATDEEGAPEETPVTTTAAVEPGEEEDEPTGTTLSTPTTDEDEATETERTEEEAEAAQAETEPLAWRNSFFSWTQGLTFNTLVQDGQQSYNPTYYWSFGLIPRWYLDPRVFLVASLGVSYEFTNADSDTYNHELALSDALLELRYTLPVDRFVFIPAIRATFPTSKASQAAQRYFNTGLGLTSVLQIPEFLSSNIALGLSYRRWWAGSNVSLAQGPYGGRTAFPAAFATGGTFNALDGDVGSSFVDSMGGAATLADRLLVALTYNMTPTSGLTVTLQGLMVFDRPFDNAEGYVGCDTIVSLPCDTAYRVEMDPTQNRWRTFTYFTLAVAYDVQPWLNLQLGVANAAVLAPLFNDDGSVRSPFNPDSQIYLSTTITLDGLYETITAGGEEDGLTPEERQRRRQGLAAVEEELLEEILSAQPEDDDSETADHGVAAPSTVAF
jgi:hypothetical protein